MDWHALSQNKLLTIASTYRIANEKVLVQIVAIKFSTMTNVGNGLRYEGGCECQLKRLRGNCDQGVDGENGDDVLFRIHGSSR